MRGGARRGGGRLRRSVQACRAVAHGVAMSAYFHGQHTLPSRTACYRDVGTSVRSCREAQGRALRGFPKVGARRAGRPMPVNRTVLKY